MKHVSIAALALAMASMTIGTARPDDSFEQLVFAAIAAPSHVSYTGTVEVIRMGSHSAEAAVYHVEHRAPGMTRRDYTAPSALAGDSMVVEGPRTLSVDPRLHRVVETSNATAGDSTALNADYALLRANYRVQFQGNEAFDGRPAMDLILINKYSGRQTMLLRLDRASKMVLDKEEFASNGALVSEVRFEEISYAASIPAADFSVPAGYARLRESSAVSFGSVGDAMKRCGFAARAPRSLPDGFSAIEGTVVDAQGVRTIQLLYSDGLRTVSVFESSKPTTLDATPFGPKMLRVGTASAEYAEDGSTALLAWSDGGLHYTLAGELGLVDLTRLAESLQP